MLNLFRLSPVSYLVFVCAIGIGLGAAPLVARAAPPFPTTVNVPLFRLNGNGGNTNEACNSSNRFAYGCTAFCDPLGTDGAFCVTRSGGPLPNPYVSTSGLAPNVPIEGHYLLDVLSKEMNPITYPRVLAATSQIIVARTYLLWILDVNPNFGLNNSNERQVYIPYAFDALDPARAVTEGTANLPCPTSLSSLNSPQRIACQALQNKQYLSQSSNGNPVFAEFFSDTPSATLSTTDPNANINRVLIGVPEPISILSSQPAGFETNCTVALDPSVYGHRRGFSQRGANRWMRGNNCPGGLEGDRPYSIRWFTPDQILFHYFSNVHLRDVNGAVMSPDRRWNPLQFFGLPRSMVPNTAYPIQVLVQNTGTVTWTCNSTDYVRLTYGWRGPTAGSYTDGPPTRFVNVCGVAPGGTQLVSINLEVPSNAYSLPGRYQMSLDMETKTGASISRFSTGGWSAYTYTSIGVVSPQAQELLLAAVSKSALPSGGGDIGQEAYPGPNDPPPTPEPTETPYTSPPSPTPTVAPPTSTPTPTAAGSTCPGNSLIANGCFETGNLSSWEVAAGSPVVNAAGRYSGSFGAQLPDGARLDQVFTTVSGASYNVSIRLRIDSQTGTPDWGGMRAKVVNSSFTQLGSSPSYTVATSPQGQWTLATFSFTANSAQSRVILERFAGGTVSFATSWDEIVITSAGPTPTPTSTPSGGPAYQQQSGSVVMEAETFSSRIDRSGDSWSVQTNQSGYAGSGFVQALPDDGSQALTGYTTTSPELQYRVNFTATGTHYVWVRMSAPDNAGDSLHMGLNGTAPTSAQNMAYGSGTYNIWVWTRLLNAGGNATLNVTATGVQTVNLWMREDGARIDRILLTTDVNYIPSGTGPAESPRSNNPNSTRGVMLVKRIE